MKDFIEIYENAFTSEWCDDVVRRFKNAKQATVKIIYSRQEVANQGERHRKDDFSLCNSSAIESEYFQDQKSKEVFNSVLGDSLKHYMSTYSILSDFKALNVYGQKIQETPIGGGYHIWHCETCDRETSDRVLVFTLYLNDVEEGGETEFLYQHKRVKPKKGTLVIFPAAFTHTHRGNPPLSNTKYISTGWVEF